MTGKYPWEPLSDLMRIQRYCQSVSKSLRLGTRVQVFLFLTSFLYKLVQGPGIFTGTHLQCFQDKLMCDTMPEEPPWEPNGECSLQKGFPESSVGKESTCNAGDLSSIPGSGRSSGEVIDYPLHSWASLVAQNVRIHLWWGRPEFDPWVGKIPWRRVKLEC